MIYYLDNNLKVYLDQDNSSNTVAFGLVFNQTGFLYDPMDKKGLSHLTEHMLFRGNDAITTEEILKEFMINGIKYNAWTKDNYIVLMLEFLPGTMSKVLDIVKKILISSNYKDEEFEKEKTIVITETEMRLNKPEFRLIRETQYALFGDSDYGLYDTKDSVTKITKDDVERWKQCHTNTENMFIVLSGNFTDEHIDLLNKTLGSLDLGNKGFKKDPKKDQGTSKFIQMDTKDQIYYGIGIPLKRKFLEGYSYTCALGYINHCLFSPTYRIFRIKYGIGYRIELSYWPYINESSIYLLIYGFDGSALAKFYKAKEEFFEKALDPGFVFKNFKTIENQLLLDKMKILQDPWIRAHRLANAIVCFDVEDLNKYFEKRYNLEKENFKEIIESMDLDKAKEVFIYKENIFQTFS